MEWVYILYFICFATIVYALKILTLYFNINIYVGKPNVSWSQHAVYKFFDDCKVDLADSSRKKLLEQKCDTFLITYSSDNYKKVLFIASIVDLFIISMMWRVFSFYWFFKHNCCVLIVVKSQSVL